MRRSLVALALALTAAGTLTACGGSTRPSDAHKAAERLSAPNSAKALTDTLTTRGAKVTKITCVDASAERQRCTGIVDNDVHTWRVDIDLATRTRDFVP